MFDDHPLHGDHDDDDRETGERGGADGADEQRDGDGHLLQSGPKEVNISAKHVHLGGIGGHHLEKTDRRADKEKVTE